MFCFLNIWKTEQTQKTCNNMVSKCNTTLRLHRMKTVLGLAGCATAPDEAAAAGRPPRLGSTEPPGCICPAVLLLALGGASF